MKSYFILIINIILPGKVEHQKSALLERHSYLWKGKRGRGGGGGVSKCYSDYSDLGWFVMINWFSKILLIVLENDRWKRNGNTLKKKLRQKHQRWKLEFLAPEKRHSPEIKKKHLWEWKRGPCQILIVEIIGGEKRGIYEKEKGHLSE